MFERPIKTLELDKVLELVSNEAVSEDAKSALLSLQPQNSYDGVTALLNRTDTAFKLLLRLPSPPFGCIKNISEPLARARRMSSLNCSELLDIAGVLRNIRLLVGWRNSDLRGERDPLSCFFDVLVPNKFLEDKIYSSITGANEIADTASEALYDIRRKIISKSAKIRETLEKIVRSSQAKFLQDSVITQREGRFVVPVKQEYRGEIKGIVHGMSSSGSTLFIEPMSVLETNNEIRVLQSKEADEEARILAELSALCGEFADSISASYDSLVTLDAIFAKAKYAISTASVIPEISKNGIVRLKRARHPLIPQKMVVPITMDLGTDYDSLIITGPNTGGKTVTLKTIGLFTLMTMCGLMIPADDGSVISVFGKVFADIGDEQSIAQSLSTFSSHMVNIVSILRNADNNTLVLLDELCAGTDPIEGAALAKAIIMKLKSSGAKTVVTTHFPELKAYAVDTERVENASCEFDVKTLKPTYKLTVGVPGKSNAFAISLKLGIANDIIDTARAQLSDDETRFERVISALEKERRKAERDAQEISLIKSRISGEKKRLEEREKEFEVKKQKIIDSARSKAEDMLERTRSQAGILLNEIEDIKKSMTAQNAAENLQKARAAFKGTVKKMEEESDPVLTADNGEKLSGVPNEGDTVKVNGITEKATVLKVDLNSRRTLVTSGVMRFWTDFDELRVCTEHKDKTVRKPRNVSGLTSRAERSVPGEIDIRGMASDEAIIELDRYIDNAVLSGITDIRIIHGKGTGVLRKSVQDHLKRHKNIKSYRLGVFGEGENGVTVAQVKD